MNLRKPDSNRGPDRYLQQVGLLAVIPALLLVAPGIGYLAGKWADDKFGTDPYLVILGIVLGFGAAGVEIYKLAKKSESLEREKDEEKRRGK